jgi:sulfite reductase beta subunit-like hemoprotein
VTDLGVTAGAFAVALAGVKLAEVAITKVVNKVNGHSPERTCKMTDRQALQLHDLHESNAPRVIELLKEIRDAVQK